MTPEEEDLFDQIITSNALTWDEPSPSVEGQETTRTHLWLTLPLLGLVLLVAAIPLHLIWVGVTGFAVMLTGVTLWLKSEKKVRFPSPSPRSGGGFLSHTQQRWESRREERGL